MLELGRRGGKWVYASRDHAFDVLDRDVKAFGLSVLASTPRLASFYTKQMSARSARNSSPRGLSKPE